MSDPANTRAEDLARAAEIGKAAGLHFVYAGNLPGRVGELEKTHCSHCGWTLISRYGYFIEEYCLTPNGCCPKCGNIVPGRWAEKFEGQITDRPFVPSYRSNFVTIT